MQVKCLVLSSLLVVRHARIAVLFLPSLVQCCSREVSQPYQSPDMSWMPRRDLSAQAHHAMRRSLRVSMHVSRRRIAQLRFGLEGRASIRWMTAAAKDKCTPAIGIWRYFKLDVLDHSLFAEMKQETQKDEVCQQRE